MESCDGELRSYMKITFYLPGSYADMRTGVVDGELQRHE